MNKKELVKYVSEKVMITERDTMIILNVMFDGIRESLENGDKVKVRDFGTFFVQERKARRAYSPIDKSPIDVPARKAVKFKSAQSLNKRIK